MTTISKYIILHATGVCDSNINTEVLPNASGRGLLPSDGSITNRLMYIKLQKLSAHLSSPIIIIENSFKFGNTTLACILGLFSVRGG